MTLHQAIEKVLRQSGKSLTSREIADLLNKYKWYVKADRSLIKTNQITARVNDHQNLFEIDHSVSPFEIRLIGKNIKQTIQIPKINIENQQSNRNVEIATSDNLKISFPPISDSNTKILILGSIPGDKSIELNEYYGHSRNRFWKIIAVITKMDLPMNYIEKKKLLLNNGIGVWDVAHRANRKGSLDTAILNEEPNDIETFISKHKNIKVVGFNGIKSEALFDKYFKRKKEIKYILLPSTSPANAAIDFENICKIWQQILH